MRRARYLLFLLVVNAVVAQAEVPKPRTPQQPLRIGVVLGATGYASVHSENMRRGIELAKEHLEAHGWRVELRYEDDATQAAKSAAAVQALVAKGYRLFIGPAWSFLMAAAAPIYSRADVVAYGPATCSKVAGTPNPHIFHGTTPAGAKLPVLRQWLEAQGVTRVAVLYAASAWGEVHHNVFIEAAKAAGAAVVFDEHYEYGEEQSTLPVLIERLRTAAPEVVLTTSSAEGSAVTVKKLADLRVTAAFLSTDDVVDAVQQRLIAPSAAGLPLYALVVPVTDAFRKMYFARYQQEPGVYSDSAYDGVMLYAAAAAATDGSPEGVRRFMRGGTPYAGVSGSYRYDERGDVVKNPYQVVRLETP